MTKVISGNDIIKGWDFDVCDLDAVKGKTVVIIKTNDDPASDTYIRNKVHMITKLGMKVRIETYPDTEETHNKILTDLHYANIDARVIGIICQLPLYPSCEKYKQEILDAIYPEKDIDCMSGTSLGKFYTGDSSVRCPATTRGIYEILTSMYPVEWYKGKKAVMIGRSSLVGQPTAHILGAKNWLDMTVTTVHSSTKNIEDYTRDADVIVIAIGVPKYLKADMVKEGAIVIDVGINRENRILVGDVDFKDVAPKCESITIVPGGVGPLTVHALMHNIIDGQGAKDYPHTVSFT